MITCEICGEQVDPQLWRNISSETGLCFTCFFWKGKTSIKNRPNVTRINGDHFTIASESDRNKGYGGQKFTIKFFDGRIITTTNLWYQGKIPEHFRKALEDNAEFVEEEKP